jgi:hypothetical protein
MRLEEVSRGFVNGDATESFRGQSVGEMELVLSNAGGTAQL